MAIESKETVEKLTSYLFESRGYGSKSLVMTRIEAAISKLAYEIADEIVAEHPDLRETLTRKVRHVVEAALRDDAFLSQTVVKSVAAGLGKVILDADIPEEQ